MSATAELGPRNERTVLKRNGIPMVLVVVRPQPGANYIAIADEFQRRVELIENTLPSDIEVAWAFDASRFIRKSVAEVRQTILDRLLSGHAGHLPLPAGLADDDHPGPR